MVRFVGVVQLESELLIIFCNATVWDMRGFFVYHFVLSDYHAEFVIGFGRKIRQWSSPHGSEFLRYLQRNVGLDTHELNISG